MKRRCVIVGGADIGNYPRILSELRDDDFFIYCDSGLKHMQALDRQAGLIVGDFDSHENPMLPTETIVLPCVKDDTDTMFAVKEAVRRGYEDFLLIGVIGRRFDHSLGNIAALHLLDSLGLSARLMDDYSQMQVVSSEAEVEDSFSYFSILSLCGTAEGIYETNSKYELCGAVLTGDDPYGISNEPIKGKTAKIRVEKGKVLLIKVY